MRLPALAHKQDTPSFVHLDAVRGIAALLVAVSHLRALFFVEYAQSAHQGIAERLLYLVTGLGHEAVLVFFVLSGFLISSSVFRSLQAGRWSWATYAISRLTRLYVVLIPALILCALWDFGGTRFFGDAGIYVGVPAYVHMALGIVSHQDTLPVWLGNLCFLQGIYVPSFGSNGPLWSLSCEFWDYVLFPLVLFAVWYKKAFRARVLCFFLVLLIVVFVGKTIVLYFLVWLMGTAVSVIPSSRLGRSSLFKVTAFLAFACSLLVSRLHTSATHWPADFLIGFTFSALVYCLANSRNAACHLYKSTARFLSQISYTLYLVHMPVLVFFSAVIVRRGSLWQPDTRHLVLALGIGALVMFYTCIVWHCTEAKTDAVRRFITGRRYLTAQKALPADEQARLAPVQRHS